MTDLPDAANLTCPPEVLSRVLDGEAVLLDLAGGRYFGANEVGTFAWERIQQGTTVGELVRDVVAAFEVDPATAAQDVAAFVAALREAGLVTVG